MTSTKTNLAIGKAAHKSIYVVLKLGFVFECNQHSIRARILRLYET